MFAIYNIQGRSFRDNLEHLKKVKQPEAIDFNQPLLQDIAQDETLVVQGASNETANNLLNKKSVDTYRKMLHANERSVIVHAYQIMQHPVITINSNCSLQNAYQLFQSHPVHQFPVFTPQLELVGLLDKVVVVQQLLNHPDSLNLPISEFLKRDVISADPVTDIRRVAKVMYEYQQSALPIVNEQDHLVGIISKTDLLKAIMMEPPISLWT